MGEWRRKVNVAIDLQHTHTQNHGDFHLIIYFILFFFLKGGSYIDDDNNRTKQQQVTGKAKGPQLFLGHYVSPQCSHKAVPAFDSWLLDADPFDWAPCSHSQNVSRCAFLLFGSKSIVCSESPYTIFIDISLDIYIRTYNRLFTVGRLSPSCPVCAYTGLIGC